MKKISFLNLFISTFLLILLSACSSSTKSNYGQLYDARAKLRSENIPYNGQTFIKYAGEGNEKVVKLFVKSGINVNINIDSTALIAAAGKGRANMVSYLIANGADVNAKSNFDNAISAACMNGNYSTVQILIKNHVDVNYQASPYGTPLMLASKNGNAKIVSLLVKNGADVNTKIAPTGTTALMLASREGNIEAAKILIEKGAKVDAKNVNGFTALSYSIKNQKYTTAELLINSGANIQAIDNATTVPFLEACADGNKDFLNFMIKKGVNIKTSAYEKVPLLIWTVKNKYDSAAEVLIEHGANIVIEDAQGKTALDYAIKNNDTNMVQYIESSMAQATKTKQNHSNK